MESIENVFRELSVEIQRDRVGVKRGQVLTHIIYSDGEQVISISKENISFGLSTYYLSTNNVKYCRDKISEPLVFNSDVFEWRNDHMNVMMARICYSGARSLLSTKSAFRCRLRVQHTVKHRYNEVPKD